jgi:hypothetical protein
MIQTFNAPFLKVAHNLIAVSLIRRWLLKQSLTPYLGERIRTFLPLIVVPQEGYPFQREHILIVIGHLVVILLPHFDKLVPVNEPHEFRGGGGCSPCIWRESPRCNEQGDVSIPHYSE